MRQHEYRVWCEFTIDGKKYTEMAGPENWFLLTQSGHLMSHGPRGNFDFDPNAEKKHDKLVVEFWTGKRDSKRTPEFPEGQKEYEGDKVRIISDYYDYISIIRWDEKTASLILDYPPGSEFDFAPVGWVQDIVEDGDGTLEVIGNVHFPVEEKCVKS